MTGGRSENAVSPGQLADQRGTDTGKIGPRHAPVAFLIAENRPVLIEDTGTAVGLVESLVPFVARWACRLAVDQHSRLVAGHVAASARAHPGRRRPGW